MCYYHNMILCKWFFSADSIFLWHLDDSSSMGGVDLSDMLMSLYRIDIRPRLWYLRMLCCFIECLVAVPKTREATGSEEIQASA